MLQNLLVGAIVLAALAYTVWALVPRSTRLGLARRLGAWGRGPGRPAWLAGATGAIERAAGQPHGDCGNCGSGPPAAPRDARPPGR